jgi:hypothetical protein
LQAPYGGAILTIMAAKTWDELYGAGATVEAVPAPVDVNISDKDVLRRLAMEKLVRIIARSPDTISVVPAIRELLDRIDGKPGQAITMDATLRTVTVNCEISFIEPQHIEMQDVTPAN